jgi:heme exporter protein D
MNWSQLISMGGYGFFVWGSYILALVILGGEVVLVMKRKRTLTESTRRAADRKDKEST